VELRACEEEVLQGGDLMLLLDEAAYLYLQSFQRYSQPARVNWLMTALGNSTCRWHWFLARTSTLHWPVQSG
jgi:hypothetical protein